MGGPAGKTRRSREEGGRGGGGRKNERGGEGRKGGGGGAQGKEGYRYINTRHIDELYSKKQDKI
jgi:hypothetical protein